MFLGVHSRVGTLPNRNIILSVEALIASVPNYSVVTEHQHLISVSSPLITGDSLSRTAFTSFVKISRPRSSDGDRESERKMFKNNSSSDTSSGQSWSANDQRTAVIVVNGRRFPCRLNEVSINGFGVSVAWTQAWVGDPVAVLHTKDSTYKVVIVKQESEHNGFHLKLRRFDENAAAQGANGSTWWVTAAMRTCAMGLAGMILVCYVANPRGFTKRARQVSAADVYNYLTFNWRDPKVDGNGKARSSASGSSLPYTAVGDSFDQSVPAVSVSMSSNGQPLPNTAPRSVVPGGRVDVDPQSRVVEESRRRKQIRDSVAMARREPMRAANAKSIPWLFSESPRHPAGERSYRISKSASADLAEFKSGLDMLSKDASAEAVQSFLDAIARMGKNNLSTPVEEIPGVNVIHSDDAAIYFTTTRGEISILRVVPREVEEDPTMVLPPSSSLNGNQRIMRSAGR